MSMESSDFNISEKDVELLEELLFKKTVSRNRDFDRFESPKNKRLHRIARHLRAVHNELQHSDSHHWVESMEEEKICLHLHRPSMGLSRKIFLSKQQWTLLQHPGWSGSHP